MSLGACDPIVKFLTQHNELCGRIRGRAHTHTHTHTQMCIPYFTEIICQNNFKIWKP